MSSSDEKNDIEVDVLSKGFNPSKHIKVQFFLLTFTVIYVYFLTFFLLSPLDGIVMTILWFSKYPLLGFATVFFSICLQISMIVSICRMWSQYSKRNYTKTYWSGLFPIFTYIVITVAAQILHVVYGF